jgi:hypothetical protein
MLYAEAVCDIMIIIIKITSQTEHPVSYPNVLLIRWFQLALTSLDAAFVRNSIPHLRTTLEIFTQSNFW